MHAAQQYIVAELIITSICTKYVVDAVQVRYQQFKANSIHYNFSN